MSFLNQWLREGLKPVMCGGWLQEETDGDRSTCSKALDFYGGVERVF